MKLWVVTETVQYEVYAETQEAAEGLYLEHGPMHDVECPVRLLSVEERTIIPFEDSQYAPS